MNRDYLKRRIQDLFDGKLSASEKVVLERELKASEIARELYIQHAQIHSLLEQKAKAVLIESSIVPVERIVSRQKRRGFKVALLSAAAVLVCALISMRLFFVDQESPVLVFETTPGSLYSLTHSEGTDLSNGSMLGNGSRLQLSQGSLELSFESGVKSIVVAPADLTINSGSNITLDRGIAWFQVPEGAEGFTVETSDLHIVDLGTEFGIIASPNECDQLHVFRGEVEACPAHQEGGCSVVSKGEACAIDALCQFEAIPLRPSAFLTSLPDSLPHLHWSFDGANPLQPAGCIARTHDVVADAIQSDSRPATDRFVDGIDGQALLFDGEGDYLRTNWTGILGNEPRTVACWVKFGELGELDYEPIAEWGKVTDVPNNGYWRFIATKSQTHADRLVLRLAVGQSWYDGQKNLADGEWHHVAVVDTGKLNQLGDPDFKFYIDGEREVAHHNERSKMLKSRETLAHFPLIVGSRRLETELPGQRSYQGLIDELFIFQGVLSSTHLRKIMNTNKPQL